jgi:hypothetical protein
MQELQWAPEKTEGNTHPQGGRPKINGDRTMFRQLELILKQ